MQVPPLRQGELMAHSLISWSQYRPVQPILQLQEKSRKLGDGLQLPCLHLSPLHGSKRVVQSCPVKPEKPNKNF
jgi:hypothetical protein